MALAVFLPEQAQRHVPVAFQLKSAGGRNLRHVTYLHPGFA
jgi:hypothetical protein